MKPAIFDLQLRLVTGDSDPRRQFLMRVHQGVAKVGMTGVSKPAGKAATPRIC
jgi:hypothetical protein